MNIEELIKDHKRKSDQLKKLKKKKKNSVPLSHLKQLLAHEEKNGVNSSHYQGWSSFDDDGYRSALSEREGKIKLLKEIIRRYDKSK